MDPFVSFFVVRIFGLFVLPGNLVLVIVMPFSKVVRMRYYCNFKTLYSINEAPDGHDRFWTYACCHAPCLFELYCAFRREK